MNKKPELITTGCPECFMECFEMEIQDSGTSFDGEYTSHWFEGEGKCLNCDYEGFICDSSH